MSETPKYGHEPINMRRVADCDSIEQVGDFCWRMKERGRVLWVAIPCRMTDGRTHWCNSLWTIDHPNSGGHQWSWNGVENTPTLSPSLHAVGIWHGYVRDGQLVEA